MSRKLVVTDTVGVSIARTCKRRGRAYAKQLESEYLNIAPCFLCRCSKDEVPRAEENDLVTMGVNQPAEIKNHTYEGELAYLQQVTPYGYEVDSSFAPNMRRRGTFL